MSRTGFRLITGWVTDKTLENGAKIGTWRFETPLPSKWQPNKMDMKRCFPVHVAFDTPGTLIGVLEVLSLCIWGVGSVLQLFEPVFATSMQPPLPVTSIPIP